MKSIIICEGGTDLTLLQYFMEKACGWQYIKASKTNMAFHSLKAFTQDDNYLYIGESGGCTRIADSFCKMVETNRLSSSIYEMYSNIIIVSDRDEMNTVDDFRSKVKECLDKNSVKYSELGTDGEWINCHMNNAREHKICFRILMLIIPFETTGALETFLLDAIAESDDYDKEIIEKSKGFIEVVDTKSRYLNHRRYKTKAVFDVYFSVRTPLTQFSERRSILRNIDWHKYETIQSSFKKLHELSV